MTHDYVLRRLTKSLPVGRIPQAPYLPLEVLEHPADRLQPHDLPPLRRHGHRAEAGEALSADPLHPLDVAAQPHDVLVLLLVAGRPG